MRREQANTKAHVYVIYVNFWELIIAFPNGGQWAPFSKVCPPLAQTSSYPIAQEVHFWEENIITHKCTGTGVHLFGDAKILCPNLILFFPNKL